MPVFLLDIKNSMGAKAKNRFVITYTNVDDGSFAELDRKETKLKAITAAKVFIMCEYFRYSRELNASIANDLHPKESPIVINLHEELISITK
jgi:hypothetical protein